VICPQVVVISTQVGNKTSTGSPQRNRNIVTNVTEVTAESIVNERE
jgi:hypothetical protein